MATLRYRTASGTWAEITQFRGPRGPQGPQGPLGGAGVLVLESGEVVPVVVETTITDETPANSLVTAGAVIDYIKQQVTT